MRETQENGTGLPAGGDEGFMLLGALVLVFLVLLALSVAAPRMAKELQRDKELESEHRANQYVRAIRVFYKKNGNHYPTSIEQLEKTNNQRFLRQRYVDPLTGKADWRLIHVGENLTQVKGFFGQELPGLQSGLGSAAGMVSSTGGSVSGSTAGSSGSAFNNSGLGAGSGSGVGGAGGVGSGLSAGGLSSGATAGAGTGAGGSGSGSAGSGSQPGTGSTGSGGLIMGVGSAKTGDSILVVNDQTTYQTWEFLYDPRIEQLYAKATLLGGVNSGSTSGNGLGTSAPGTNGAAAPGSSPSAPGTGPGTVSPSTPSPGTPPQ